mmetsp:Transcript_23407/g.38233  ORF Transcript_23407/g.38233 Transcript_23407/m.38233 type:complete len:87 (+) Transcript_23407:1159-1419(+)
MAGRSEQRGDGRWTFLESWYSSVGGVSVQRRMRVGRKMRQGSKHHRCRGIRRAARPSSCFLSVAVVFGNRHSFFNLMVTWPVFPVT